MIAFAEESDLTGIRRLHRRYCSPDIPGSIELRVQHEDQMFVERNSEGDVIGMVLVGTIFYGLARVGEVYEVEAYQDEVVRSLITACLRWLAERYIDIAYISPRDDQQRALLATMGFADCAYGMYREPPPQPVPVARHTSA